MNSELLDRDTLQLWGGIECTINRVNDRYFEQLKKGGHYFRKEDLDLIANLGIKTIRYPVLWEQIAPKSLKDFDWGWTDERLYKLKELGIKPIAGLLHHGSGPTYTSLIDPDFPQKFSTFAFAVAERYPWLELFTPVNEPLTTARFSGMYGLWFPHGTDDHTFAQTLLNQCKGIILAMKAIREVIPNAKLIQTEDLGKTHSTKKLRYQADFENERRWASFDLLCGTLSPDMKFYKYLIDFGGINSKTLDYFSENFCQPDIFGINHYITSERYLDHRLDKYPSWLSGGNGVDQYADVEVVRVAPNLRAGHYNLLKETYDRYRKPIAITELHIGCTRDEQLRWFKEAWDASSQLKEEGIPLIGVTAWSLLGAHDWNSLLTKDHNHYEEGVFDYRNGKPRRTALAHYIEALAKGEEYDHTVLSANEWWRRPESILFPDDPEFGGKIFCEIGIKSKSKPFRKCVAPLLITGATGTLGKAFAHICDHRAIPFILLNRTDLDIADQEQTNKILEKYEPWAVINAAGYVKVDEAEENADHCFRENTTGPTYLAKSCMTYQSQFVNFSTDLVFDGINKNPYLESNMPMPLNNYGMSKWEAEKAILKINPAALIIRTSSFFGPWDQSNFLTGMIKTLQEGNVFKACSEVLISPTFVPDLVNATLDLLIDQEKGIWHLANPSQLSWFEFARHTAEMAGLDVSRIIPASTEKLGWKACRPANSALSSERGVLLPPLDHAINRYLNEVLNSVQI